MSYFEEEKRGLLCEPHRIINKKAKDLKSWKFICKICDEKCAGKVFL